MVKTKGARYTDLWSIPADTILVPSRLKSALNTSSLLDLKLYWNNRKFTSKPVSLHSSKDGNVVFSLDVPKSESMVL